MKTPTSGMAVAAVRPKIDEALRHAAQSFEALFLAEFDSIDWHEGKRITRTYGKDLRRRPEMHSLQRIGAVLALLGREHPEKLRALFAGLEAWALALNEEPVCLLTAAQHEAREDADADQALLALLGQDRTRLSIERAVRELAQQVAAIRRVMVAAEQQRPAIAHRVVRPAVLVAAGARR
jgi:hypothetical protein